MKKSSKFFYWLAEFLFFIHIPIFVFWVVLFFIPLQWWPARVTFHFYYILIMAGIQIAGGILWLPVAGRFDLRCPLTIIMQWARGYSLCDPKAYNHAFIVELFERIRIKPKKKTITFLIIFSIVLVMCQYFFGFLRIP